MENRDCRPPRSFEIPADPPLDLPDPWRRYKVPAPDDLSLLHARLNSKGTHVVCGIEACGARLATVFKPTAYELAEFGKTMNVLAHVHFLPGWAPRNDGLWVFSRYAKLRRRRGQTVKVRRYPVDNGIITGNDVMDSDFDLLPGKAKCSECGFVNLLTEQALGVRLIARIPASPVKASGPPKYVV